MTHEEKIKAAKIAQVRMRQSQMAQADQPERGLGQRLYDNIVGDPNDGVTSTGEALGTWLNRAGESMTLGVVGDEASAAAYAPIKRGLAAVGLGGNEDATYASERDRFRANEEAMSTTGRLSADLTGAVLPALAGVKVLSSAATLGGAAGRGAALGGASGGLYGFMEGEGVSDRTVGSLINAGLGSVVGGAIPPIAAGAGRAYQGVRNALADRAVGREIGQGLGISPRAGRLAADVASMDDPSSMRNALARPSSMLADAGPTTQGALDAAIQAPGEGARTALSRIDDRARQAGDNLGRELDRSLSTGAVANPSSRQFSDTARLQGDIRQATAPARKAVYERAYAQPIDYSSPQGAALLDDISPRLPSEAISYANKLMRIRDQQSQQIMATVADDGTVTFANPPDVRQWDYIKQALDGLAESGDGAGAMGGQTRMGSAYQGLAREIRRNLGEAVPEYDYAVNTAGDIIGQVRSIKTGEQLLTSRVTRAEAEAALDGMSAAERGAVKRGLRQSIDDRLAQVRAVATDPNVDIREAQRAYQDLSSRASRDKMRMLLGDDWQRVETALDDAGRALGLRARVATNSRTFGRQQFGEMLDESTTPGAIRSGQPIGTARAVWQRVTGASPDRVARQRGHIRNELSDILTRPNALQILDTIEGARSRNALAPDTGALVEYLANTGLMAGNTARAGN